MATSVRERVRAEYIEEIKTLAFAQLAEVGAAGLSLRAIARDLGMVSSAVYRYVPSRDHLLTLLIMDAYDRLGEAAEAAEAAVDRDDVRERWRVTCHAARRWALDNPSLYALIFGTPVPGYAAPEDTIGPATRFPQVILGILGEVHRRGDLVTPPTLPSGLDSELAGRLDEIALDVPAGAFAVGLMAWTQVFGTISFELFGHFHNVVDDGDAFFGLVVESTLRRFVEVDDAR